MKYPLTYATSPLSAKRRRIPATLALLASMVAVTGCSTEELGPPGDPDPTEAPLLRPAAGEVITIGTKQPIQWTPSGDVAAVDVQLTLPDGSVQIIAEDVPNEGSYQWSVPLVYSQATRAYTISVLPSDSAGEPRSLPIQGVGDHLTVGSIAGFKWNGANEEYYWIDLVTGESQVIGTVGDLTLWEWKGASAFDASNGLIYAVGAPDDSTSVRKIYTFDAATGALISDTVLQGPHPSGLKVNASGQVLGMRWNGSYEEIVAVDPGTGAITTLGTVGDMSIWSTESAIDNNHDRLYVIAINDPDYDAPTNTPGPNAAWSVFTLDSMTGALLDTQPLGPMGSGIGGVATTSAGGLVGFRWNGSAEELIGIDPATGAISVLGTVGDLMTWSGYTAINPTTDEIYVFGVNAANESKLYTLNATTGDLLYDLPIADSPTSTLLVY